LLPGIIGVSTQTSSKLMRFIPRILAIFLDMVDLLEKGRPDMIYKVTIGQLYPNEIATSMTPRNDVLELLFL